MGENPVGAPGVTSGGAPLEGPAPMETGAAAGAPREPREGAPFDSLSREVTTMEGAMGKGLALVAETDGVAARAA